MLAHDPNQDFVINADTEAKAFLAPLGVINQFSQQTGFAGGSTQMITVSTHPTHWVAALLFSGHKKAIDNGYTVFAWSKRRHPMDEINGEIERLWRQFLQVPFEQTKYFRIEPDKN